MSPTLMQPTYSTIKLMTRDRIGEKDGFIDVGGKFFIGDIFGMLIFTLIFTSLVFVRKNSRAKES